MKRRRLVVALVSLLVAAWMTAGVIHAITNGRPDGDNHPYVGFLLFYAPDADGNVVPQWYCSGSLIAPNVVLTAGHCTEGASYAEVWFRSDLKPLLPPGGITGTAHTHPNFTWHWQGLLGWDTVDSGVVVLDTAVTSLGYAELPTVGLVDSLPMMTDVDIVGYGAQFKDHVSGNPYYRWDSTWERYYAPSQVIASENKYADRWLKLTANPAQGKGGICFGDSGGPDLLGGTDVILATNSFVANSNCAGVNYSNRVDRAVVLEWVRTFLE